jgi:hypothetical protein
VMAPTLNPSITAMCSDGERYATTSVAPMIHLSFVAGASKLQRKELSLHGVSTLEALAALPLPIPFSPTRGAREGYTRIRE